MRQSLTKATAATHLCLHSQATFRNGYLSGLSRPEQAVYFFREVLHGPAITKEVLRQRTQDYRNRVEAFARNHNIPIEWAEKGVREEEHILPWLRRQEVLVVIPEALELAVFDVDRRARPEFLPGLLGVFEFMSDRP